MPLLVDAYNVLQTVGVLPKELAHIELAGLIGLLSNSRYRHEHSWLICDGGPRKAGLQRPTGQITVQYAGPGREADDVIEHRIADAPQPKQLKVVSSDRRLRKAARVRRCPVVDSSRFLEQLLSDYTTSPDAKSTPTRRPHRLTPEQVQQWIIEFDLANTPWLEIASASPADVEQPRPAPKAPPPGTSPPRSAPSRSHPVPSDTLAEATAMVRAYEASIVRVEPTPPSPSDGDEPHEPGAKDRPSRHDSASAPDAPSPAKVKVGGKLDDAAMQQLFPGVRPLDK